MPACKTPARSEPLEGGDWYGIYELSGGRFLYADESDYIEDDYDDYDDEPNEYDGIVGAVYYDIYTRNGGGDGGWMGYDGDGTWGDLIDFVSASGQGKVGRRISRSVPDELRRMLEDGADPKDVYAFCGVSASRRSASKPKAKAPAKKTTAKKTTAKKPASRSTKTKTAPKATTTKKAPAKKPAQKKSAPRKRV